MSERYVPSGDDTPDVPFPKGTDKDADIQIRTRYMGDKPVEHPQEEDKKDK